MFQSRKNRRRDRSISTRSRRLGVEPMEGRLMLSADGLSLPHYPLSGVNLTWSTGQSTINAVPTATVIPQPIEGGYINLDSDVVTSQWNILNTGQQIGNPDLQLLFGVAGQDMNVVPVRVIGNPDLGQISLGVLRAVSDFASSIDSNVIRFNSGDSFDSTGL